MTVQDFDPAGRFVAGTVGPVGQRAFYLQVSDDTRFVTVGLEKEQVAVLAERMNAVLDQLAPEAAPPGEPGGAPEDTEPLQTPFDEDWRVQTLALSWDEARRVMVIECHDHDPDEVAEVAEEGPGGATPDRLEAPLAGPTADRNTLRIVLEPVAARAFARRGVALVAAGRPPCPFCGGPLDASGHVCPRANGYRR